MARPRVAELLLELQRERRVVMVTATAGAGKTTAVIEAIAAIEEPIAWLTVDTSDASPGRLLTYLEAALLNAVPGMSPAASEALAAGLGHVEAAGLLAEATSGVAVMLVIDELERLGQSEEALAVLSAFLRYAPAALRATLISRRRVPLELSGRIAVAGIGHIDADDLAFTVEEAAGALKLVGREAVDASEAVDATGGWVAGVLFEAWRMDGGERGDGDPLNGYLSTEIMAQLEEGDRDFLIAVSLLDEVTPERAKKLGLEEAAGRLERLRAHHLPVVFAAEGLAMRCHPRFREYLRGELERRDDSAVPALREAYAELLVGEGRFEEAADELFRLGLTAKAEAAAEEAIMDVLKRGDRDVAERWLTRLPRDHIDCSPTLTEAELRVALEREEYGVGAACADRLLEMFGDEVGRRLSSNLAGAIAWCYFLVCRIEDAQAVLRVSPAGPHREIMSFAVGVDIFAGETHYRDRPPDSGDVADNMLARIDLLQGRFQRLLDRPRDPWTRSSYIGALRATGRLDEALARFTESNFNDWTTVRMYVELMADLKRPEEAWTALIDGRPLLERAGSGVFRMFARLLEVMLALRFDRNVSMARAALSAIEREPTAMDRIRIVEQLHLWRGMIGLIEDRPEVAAEQLREAVAIMTRWDRWLFLCQAAVYLAEAEWRLGNEEAADAAADLALETAHGQGSNHLLLEALREFPAVASRQVDRSPDPDSPWHEIGRLLQAEERLWHPGLTPRVRLLEFGAPAILVDGREVFPNLAKSYELLAYLACHDNEVVRKDLLNDLFEGRADESARAYVRQAVNKLRRELPPDVPLVADAGDVRWEGGGLTTESLEAASALQQAAELQGRQRVDAVLAALAPFERGEYLPQARSEWADERREELGRIAVEARLGAAEAAFSTGDLAIAEELVRQVLLDDPLREGAWRLSMRLAAAMGNDDRVISEFRHCEERFAEVGISPAESTRHLLEQLRR